MDETTISSTTTQAATAAHTAIDSITRTGHHTCPLCEACCNLAIETRGREVTSIRGDAEDVFSHGFVCPKAPALIELDGDPDRLRRPQIRSGEGASSTWRDATWEEAFAEIDRRLRPILETHGPDATAVYLGNPSAHHVGLGLYSRVLLRGLRTRKVFSASTLDQMPKQVSAGLMFGAALSVPVPDVDRTDHLIVMGANPLVSNGSLMTAPGMRLRLRALRERGGKLVVIDPRRTRTAEAADEHHFIRPGTDALLLLAMIQTIFAERLARPGALADLANGLDELEALAQPFAPEAVAAACGIDAATIRRLARELAAARSAAVYARIGTCTQAYGTATSWLVDALNFLTGNLDREGGAMFPKGAAGAANTLGEPGRGRGITLGRWKSRVRGIAEALGELPAACLAEEITTPGDGKIRALFTIAGNPVLSSPDGASLAHALAQLDCMVSLDIYRNETTRFAHVILPGLSPLEQSHFPFAFMQLAVRNFARYSPALFPIPEGQKPEWEVLLHLAGIAGGQGPTVDVDAFDDLVLEDQLAKALGATTSPIHGRDPAEIRRMLSRFRGPERLIDLMIRTGPYGDGFGARPDGLTLASLMMHPHGVDLGPLAPRMPDILRTPSGRIELVPAPLLPEVERLRGELGPPAASVPARDGVRVEVSASAPDGGMVLIGRRELRSNNSWMHNVPGLVAGRNLCTLQVSQIDAARLGLADGAMARVRSRVGAVDAPVEVTDALMPGVVSLPHGFGHDDPNASLATAREHAGVNSNLLADPLRLDELSGNAVLNGIPVTVEPAVG